MKVKFCLNLGISNKESDIIEFDDAEFESMSETDIDEYISEEHQQWVWDQIDAWWEEVEDEEANE